MTEGPGFYFLLGVLSGVVLLGGIMAIIRALVLQP